MPHPRGSVDRKAPLLLRYSISVWIVSYVCSHTITTCALSATISLAPPVTAFSLMSF